ncbi:asparagine synthetase B family protein [Massilia endophytica]|uniref:asparagine synthetase B family protein n=1 Tax=Massilia endophytica TaxID=2899220 RepID=UPI001E453601|nr:asparagine synthase-related protein [Massilia endophytica]UGQ46220.1 asparagine synthase C-terminal domain-containing protein [Massilia endophytica]
MGGLCGWIGSSDEQLHTMAAPLARFDSSPLHSASGGRSALALCAHGAAADIAGTDGLLTAVWGRPVWRDPALARLAEAEGHAHVLASLWQQGADRLCERMEGAFALAVIDNRKGEALLAADRMGIHPLFWSLRGETLRFASLADCLRRQAEVDLQSVYNYVYFHMVPGPATIYRGIERLLPGHFLHYRQGRARVDSYWRMRYSEGSEQPFPDLKEAFLRQLREGVSRAAQGASTGAFLSGGTDSSTIAGMLTDLRGEPARTYSIGFDAKGYDEMDYARLAARYFGTAHHEYYVSPNDVVSAIPRIAAVFDQPFGNASAVPAFYCARMAKEDGVERLIGGDGGDELFGGNERYAKQQLFGLYGRVPLAVRKGVLEPLLFGIPGTERVRLLRKARSYVEQASVPMPARLETYNLLERYGPGQVFTSDFLHAVSPELALATLREQYNRSGAASPVNRMLELDLKITLADNDLPKVRKACELAGLDSAFPFLDDAIVAFSSRLSPRQKLRGRKLRWFFKEALRGYLPDEIIAKQKHGFGLPFGIWLQQHKPLQELAADSLAGLARRGIIRPHFAGQLLGQHLQEHAGYHGTMAWVLMMLEQWYRERTP